VFIQANENDVSDCGEREERRARARFTVLGVLAMLEASKHSTTLTAL
jgi:hypothetical protein